MKSREITSSRWIIYFWYCRKSYFANICENVIVKIANGVKCLLISDMLYSKQIVFINDRVCRVDRRNRLDTFLYTKRETNEYNILYYVLYDDKALINLRKVSWKTFICIVVILSKISFIFIYEIILWLFEIQQIEYSIGNNNNNISSVLYAIIYFPQEYIPIYV